MALHMLLPLAAMTRIVVLQVRAELAPWEAQMAEVQSRIGVATSERDLLLQRQADARGRLDSARSALEAARATAQQQTAEIKRINKEMEEQRCGVCACVCVVYGRGDGCE